jgi:O-antigen/teichoic acid export membrane protein
VLRKEAIDHLQRGEGLGSLVRLTVAGLILCSAIPFVGVLLFGPELFATLFGDKWAEAGAIVQILTPGIVLEFVAFPLAAIFLVTDTQHYTLRVQLAGFVALVTALALGRHYLDGFLATCYLISAVMVATNLTSIVLAARVSGASVRLGRAAP